MLIGTATGEERHALCWPVDAASTVGTGRYGPSGSTVRVSQTLLGAQVLAALRIDGNARLVSIGRDCTGWQDITLPVGSREARVGELSGGLLLATTDQTSSRLWLRDG